ncbi:hypothetical protein DVK06_01775 [Halorubrum sp. Atlit-28R]|nr:hypothetical protein DVK06_01775 [Halorubrum sp. Atlit-28R]
MRHASAALVAAPASLGHDERGEVCFADGGGSCTVDGEYYVQQEVRSEDVAGIVSERRATRDSALRAPRSSRRTDLTDTDSDSERVRTCAHTTSHVRSR